MVLGFFLSESCTSDSLGTNTPEKITRTSMLDMLSGNPSLQSFFYTAWLHATLKFLTSTLMIMITVHYLQKNKSRHSSWTSIIRIFWCHPQSPLFSVSWQETQHQMTLVWIGGCFIMYGSFLGRSKVKFANEPCIYLLRGPGFSNILSLSFRTVSAYDVGMARNQPKSRPRIQCQSIINYHYLDSLKT